MPAPSPTVLRDLYGDLPDEIDNASDVWKANTSQAAALGAIALLVISTVAGAGLRSWQAYVAIAMEAIALPPLILYVVCGFFSEFLRTEQLRSALMIGQVASVIGLGFFVAVHSVIAAILFAVSATACVAWLLVHIRRAICAPFYLNKQFIDPRRHKTKKDRLFWAIWQTGRELRFPPDQPGVPSDFGVNDYDGATLSRCQFPCAEIKAQFERILRHKLCEAAAAHNIKKE